LVGNLGPFQRQNLSQSFSDLFPSSLSVIHVFFAVRRGLLNYCLHL